MARAPSSRAIFAEHLSSELLERAGLGVAVLDAERRVAHEPQHVVVAGEHPEADRGPVHRGLLAQQLPVRVGVLAEAGIEGVELDLDRAHDDLPRSRGSVRSADTVPAGATAVKRL